MTKDGDAALSEDESTTSQLARILGVSHTAVQKAEKRGRIKPVRYIDTGKRSVPIYNTEQAVADWAANTSQAKKRDHKEGGRPRNDGKPTKPRSDLTSNPLADKLVPPAGGGEPLHPMRPGHMGRGALKTGGEPREPRDPPEPGGPDDGQPTTYNEAARREKFYKAELARLEFEQKTGVLVPIDAVAKEVEREYSRVRARLLAIPSKLAPDVALTDDVPTCRALIEAAVNDVLNELAADAAATANAGN